MMSRIVAALAAGLTSLVATAAFACDMPGQVCMYAPAAPAYAPQPDDAGAAGRPAYHAHRHGGWARQNARVARAPRRMTVHHRAHGYGYVRESGYETADGRGYAYHREYAYRSDQARPCGDCAPRAIPASPAPAFEAEEAVDAPAMNDSFFYGGLSGGAGPGIDVAGFGGGGGGGFSDGFTGFGGAEAAAFGHASAFGYASASATATAFASSMSHSGYQHGCGCVMPMPKPKPHGCGCGGHHGR